MVDDPHQIRGCDDELAECHRISQNLRAILDSMAEGLLTLDDNLRVQTFNRAAEEILGVSREEVIGRSCTEVLGGHVCEKSCVLKQLRDTGEDIEDFEARIVTQQGHERTLAVTVSLLRGADGHRVGLVVLLRDISELRRLQEQIHERFGFHNIVGKNQQLQRIYQLIELCANSGASVLIEGESGTGKELVTQAIHYESPRASGPNCSALAESLLESELFGHVKGRSPAR